jgi:hypothetical protein
MAEQVYQPRNPKASPLWRCVDAHFEEFLQVYSERYQPRYGVLRDVIPEDVLAPVPHRHSILALPKMLRPYFKFHRALLKDLCRIAHQCLTEYFRSAVGLPEAVPAAVMVIHTFGEYLVDFHPHLHALVADGLFDPQGASTRCPRRSSSGHWKRCSAAG